MAKKPTKRKATAKKTPAANPANVRMLKQAKEDVANARRQAAACRKAKITAEKEFLIDPSATVHARTYRDSVSAFIKASRAVQKFSMRVIELS